MGLYLYCFLPPSHAPGTGLASVAAGPISRVSLPWIDVWFEETETVPRAEFEAIRRHDAVVRSAWSTASACLPVRFGQWLPDRGALEERLEERRAELERALTRVTGAGEHGIRISEKVRPAATGAQERASEAPPPPGRAYLERARARVRAQEAHARAAAALGAELEEALGDAIRAQRVETLPPEKGIASVAHLVGRDREPEYRERVRAFAEGHVELEMVETGPWPPYSFSP